MATASAPEWAWWLPLVPASLAIVVGAIVALVGVFQWQTARTKLKADLFDRRFEVYSATERFVAAILRHGGPKGTDNTPFLVALDKARFVFGDTRIFDFMEKVRKESNRLAAYEAELSRENRSGASVETIERRSELFSWFDSEYRRLAGVFEPFMKLKG
ncbi:hypothetical protein sos41_12070 [Alphaproteobacteria bacterium SO-S41]|nr:hypothetical protein sos41_12070 [Alphaproteobacteria bacterium SO-S41]